MSKKVESSSAMRKLIISEILVVGLLLISFLIFKLLYAQRPAVQPKDVGSVLLNVDVFAVNPLNFQELLTGFGTVQPDREVILAAQVTGEINNVSPQLKVGVAFAADQHVSSPEAPSARREADLLLRIDPDDYQQRVDQATARIAEASTEIEQLNVQLTNVARQLKKGQEVLATLQQEYRRIEEGVKRQAASPSDLNRSLLEVQRYEDAIIQLENQLASLPHKQNAAEQRLLTSRSEKKRAELDLNRTDVRPPFSGVLSEVFVEDGQYVRAGEPLVRLTDLSRVEVPIALSFDDYLQISEGISEGVRPLARLSENESADRIWDGRIVRAAPQADAQSRTVQVFVEVYNDDSIRPLLPGAFVHARIEGESHENTLLIPREAIVEGYVYTVGKDGFAKKKKLQLGRRLQSLVIVKQGLNAGDRVILTNLDIVEDGRQVVVQSVRTTRDEMETVRNPVIKLTQDQ